jgi:hypothetical protein
VYLKVRSSYTDIKLETRKEPPINIYLLDGLFVVVLVSCTLFYEYCYGLFPRGTDGTKLRFLLKPGSLSERGLFGGTA